VRTGVREARHVLDEGNAEGARRVPVGEHARIDADAGGGGDGLQVALSRDDRRREADDE
jgi:hypothetical protein